MVTHLSAGLNFIIIFIFSGWIRKKCPLRSSGDMSHSESEVPQMRNAMPVSGLIRRYTEELSKDDSLETIREKITVFFRSPQGKVN